MSQLIPYLAVRDARAALAWYADAFGARVVGDPYVMDDDRIGHAEVQVADATVYLADEYPELGLVGPEDGKVSVSLHLTVPDVDAAVDRAVQVGAVLERPVYDAPYGRTGVIVDPYGHRWMLQTPAQAAGVHVAPRRHRVPDAPGARRRPRARLLRGGAGLVGRPGPRPRRLAGPGHDADDRHRRRLPRTRPSSRCTPSTTSRSPSRRSGPRAARPARSTGSRTGSPPSAATTRGWRFYLGQLG